MEEFLGGELMHRLRIRCKYVWVWKLVMLGGVS